MNKALLITFLLVVVICGEALSDLPVRKDQSGFVFSDKFMRQHSALRRGNLQVKYFDGTNQFGRTYSEQCEFVLDAAKRRRFAQAYSKGVDDFGRTYDEKEKFEKQFDIKEFLGYTFASPLNEKRTEKMSTPFRLFERATLEPTAKGRLGSILFDRETTDVSNKDLNAETLKLAAILECTYGITFDKASNVQSIGAECGLCPTETYKFSNDKISITVEDEYETKTGSGWLGVKISKPSLIEADKHECDREKIAAIEKTQKPVCISFAKDIDRLPNSIRMTTAVKVLSDEFEKDPSVSLGRLRYLAGEAMHERHTLESKPKTE